MPVDLHHSDFDPAAFDLSELHRAAWAELAIACHQPQHGWRLPSLATVFNQTPQQRTVVLRQVEQSEFLLFAHTDSRSSKISQLQQNSQTSWLFYDQTIRVQLVMQGIAQLHQSDALADRQWTETPNTSRLAYLTESPPGSVATGPVSSLPDRFQNHLPNEDELYAGRENFAVIVCEITEVDLLFIRRSGNLRAHFGRESDRWKESWLIP